MLVTCRDIAPARLPPMGWSTWLTCEDPQTECGHDVCNEKEVKANAQAMIDKGMHKLGWRFVAYY